jgi:glycosyltransferase involved in cell wall biosynthesis
VLAFLAAKLHRVPIVTTFHGWIGNSRKQRALIALDKRVGRGFDRVIAVSERIRQDALAAGVPAARLRLIHNAIVVDRYRRTGRRGLLAEVCGRTVPGPVIGSIGRLSAEKGHVDLVEALALVARQGRDFSAVLVGDGPERPRLEALIARHGLHERVHLPGYLPHPDRLLEEMDLMVLPSHTEGLPNAVLEALLMEVPVLATRVGGTPEVVTDGETGFLVAPQAPAELAGGIVRFLDRREDWQETARAGRRMVLARFDFRARTSKLEALYLELLGREAAR